MTSRLSILCLSLFVAGPAAAAARRYKPMNVDTRSLKAVRLMTPHGGADQFAYRALLQKKPGNPSSFLVERSGGITGRSEFSRVNISGRSFRPIADFKMSDFRAYSLRASSLVAADLPSLKLLVAKDGSGKAFLQRSGGFIRPPMNQATYSAISF